MEYLDLSHPERRVRIWMRMDNKKRSQLIQLLVEYQDVFAWHHMDMSKIDRNIIEHCLSVSLDVRKVWQKRRSFSTEKYATIVEEVHRLLTVGFI